MVKRVCPRTNVNKAQIWYVHLLDVDVLALTRFTGMEPTVVFINILSIFCKMRL
jgi:hypothetical protein